MTLQRVVPSGSVSGHSGSLLVPVVLVFVVVALVVDAAPPAFDVLAEALPPALAVASVLPVPMPPLLSVVPESEPPAAASLAAPPDPEPPASEPVVSVPAASEFAVAELPLVVVAPLPPAAGPLAEAPVPPPVGPSSKKSCCASPQAAESKPRDSRLHLSCGRIVGESNHPYGPSTTLGLIE